MAEFIGVKSYMDVWKSGSLKRDALMFQRIAVPGLDFLHEAQKVMPTEQLTEESLGYYAELCWLENQGIVFQPNRVPDYDLFHQNEEYKWYVEKESSLMDQVIKLSGQDIDTEDESIMGRVLVAAHENTRHTAIMLREVHRMDSHPVFAGFACPIFAPNTKQCEVVSIVLKSLPVPDDSIAWEHIIDYRSDPDSVGKFIDLRNWMHEVARSQLTPIEIEQKLEYLMSQYQRHMNVHKMKTQTIAFKKMLFRAWALRRPKPVLPADCTATESPAAHAQI